MPFNKLLGIDLKEAIEGPFFLPGTVLQVTNDTAICVFNGWYEESSCGQPFATKMQRQGHSVAVLSYPDFDNSTCTELVRAIWTQLLEIRSQGIKKIYLAGFSLGGLIAFQLATLKERLKLEYGLEVMGVIAISPPLRLRWYLHLPSEAIRASTFDRQLAKQISRFSPTFRFPHSEYALEEYWRSKVNRTWISIIELIRAIRFTNLILKDNTLQLPVLVVVSEKDELVDSRQTTRIAKKRIRQVEVVEVPGGHNSLLSNSCPIVCEVVHGFISRIQGN
ncbi:alpha/beta hydrolase [Shimazuella sp. AN120528]|uniref:alpha/beta hydrolase n=1 Tax=Shimazuella soli TaxID=1892854 RepID=UPI001F0FA698|nr:alpha/beta hydrolase [Shimazuella soli]MCH5586206.1 alpha/beta hydrolase [Shimazuella soli]